jgi:hypothetical protein
MSDFRFDSPDSSPSRKPPILRMPTNPTPTSRRDLRADPDYKATGALGKLAADSNLPETDLAQQFLQRKEEPWERPLYFS